MSRRLAAVLAGLGCVAILLAPVRAELPPGGAKIVFLGDVVTQVGAQRPGGFVHLVEMAFGQQDHAVVIIPLGADSTSKDMLARFPRDVIGKKPDWVVLSCGIADVSRGGGGVPLDQFGRNMTSMADEAKAAGVKMLLVTATMITEDPANPLNKKLAAYNDFTRALAKQDNLPLADANAAMQAAVLKTHAETQQPGNTLTTDGIRLNGVGDEMMATVILQAFGFTDTQLAQSRDVWLDFFGGMQISPQTAISVRQYLQLRALATSEGVSVDALISDTLNKELLNLLVASSSLKSTAAQHSTKPTHHHHQPSPPSGNQTTP